ncbi:DUF2971 domain-containing protein [Brevibacillus borstelensis]|uniref:DUF2971 domain-containing protein n=1 Tax=Brevibacillus borstelensis TaxID=45462 RepID=UPI0030FC0E94
MDLNFKGKAYFHAMEFESVYDYSEQYKVHDNPTVWRYMDLKKFEDLLNSKSLFFAKPSAFIDPLEGSYSKWDIESFREDGEFPFITSREYMKKVQDFAAVSCWHINEHESAGMWDLYLNSKDGIALKSDYNSLYNSMNDLRYRLFSGKVQYIDFDNEMTSRNIYDTLFYKRKSFSHENELRLMIIASRYDEWYLERTFEMEGIPFNKVDEKMEELEESSYEFSHEKGTLIPYDLNKLIHGIYVSPRSSPAVVDDVKKMVLNNGLANKSVIQSDLYSDFIY